MVETKGRPPKDGDRYPSGKLKPQTYNVANLRSEAQFQRMKEQAIMMGLDPIMTSQAGRLFCTGLITGRHMATIDYIAKVYAAYERHAGKGATRTIRSPSYEPSTNRSERLDEDQDQEDAAITAKREFEQLQELIPVFPREMRDAVERLCVDDEMIPTSWIADLCVLLTNIEECRAGTASTRIKGGERTLRRKAKAAKPSREEKFEAGAYVHIAAPEVKADRLANLSGDALVAAERDREGLMRTLAAREAKKAATP